MNETTARQVIQLLPMCQIQQIIADWEVFEDPIKEDAKDTYLETIWKEFIANRPDLSVLDKRDAIRDLVIEAYRFMYVFMKPRVFPDENAS